jgi:hypothetical protein
MINQSLCIPEENVESLCLQLNMMNLELLCLHSRFTEGVIVLLRRTKVYYNHIYINIKFPVLINYFSNSGIHFTSLILEGCAGCTNLVNVSMQTFM